MGRIAEIGPISMGVPSSARSASSSKGTSSMSVRIAAPVARPAMTHHPGTRSSEIRGQRRSPPGQAADHLAILTTDTCFQRTRRRSPQPVPGSSPSLVTVLPLNTPACPPRITPSPTCAWSPMPTCPANHRAFAHCARAGDAGQRNQNYVFADVAVVPHVHQVVDLRAAADARFAPARRGRWSSWRRSRRRPRSPTFPAAETACRRPSSGRAHSRIHPRPAPRPHEPPRDRQA